MHQGDNCMQGGGCGLRYVPEWKRIADVTGAAIELEDYDPDSGAESEG